MCWNITLTLLSWKLLLPLKLKILCTEYAQLTQLVRLSDEGTFKRALVVQHNAPKNFRDTRWNKNYHSRVVIFCIACSWKNSDRNCTIHNFCRVRCDWDNLAQRNFPSPQVTRCVHWVQWAYACCFEHDTLKYFHILCEGGCACVFLLWVTDKYVIHQPGGSYWVRLCPRSWVPLLKTERTVFPNTDRPRLMNNSFFFLNFTKCFPKGP